MANYERLSGLDETFLAFETRAASMHVAVTAIFDDDAVRLPSGGIDMERIRAHIASRLATLPRFRQRLGFVPLLQDAIWIDDDGFDLAYHVRHASLPRPGSDAQLRERCAEILERPLSRDRPLWEIWIIEGLEDHAFALLAKVHHCIVDGIAGVGVLANLLSLAPQHAPEPCAPWRPRPAPSTAELLRDEMARRVRGTLAIGRAIGRGVASPERGARELGAAASGLWRLARTGLTPAPATSLNRPIGPHRRVAWIDLDLELLKRIKRRLGGTLNDVVLAAVAGALRATLARHGGTPEAGMLRAAVPVSVRGRDEAGAGGNRVSLWIVPLPLREPDPRQRLSVVRAITEQLKQRNEAAGAAVLTQAADWTGAAFLGVVVRALNNARIYNLIVTNVPGPPVPLYLLGARLRAAYPHLPLFENQGLGVALLSYIDRLFVGLTADWDHGAVLDDFARYLREATADLADAAALGDVAAVAVALRPVAAGR